MNFAVLYARVSTATQAKEGTSLDSQLAACRRFATDNSYSVVKEIVDGGASGGSLLRDGMDEVRELVRSGSVQAVICYAIDRMNRDLGDLLYLDKEFAKYGVRLAFVKDEVERTPAGILFFQMRGAFAEFEKAQIKERSRRGKLQTAAQGKVLVGHYTAYGYRGVVGEGRLEVVEEEAEWVRRIFRWVAEEHITLYEVVTRLTEGGAPRKRGGARWHPGTVRNILHNPVYKGQWAFNKSVQVEPRTRRKYTDVPVKSRTSERPRPVEEWVFVEVPALVSASTWQAAQEVLEANRHDAKRRSKRYYLLRGMLYCEVCGSRLEGYVSQAGPRSDKTYYYTCRPDRDRGKARACGTGYLPCEVTEDRLWGEVLRQFLDPQALEEVARARAQPNGAGSHSDQAIALEREAETLRSRQEQLKRQEERLLRLYLSDDSGFEEASIKAEAQALKRRRKALDEELEALDARRKTQEDAGQLLRDWQVTARYLESQLLDESVERIRAALEHLRFRAIVGREYVTLPTLPRPAYIPRKEFRRQSSGSDYLTNVKYHEDEKKEDKDKK